MKITQTITASALLLGLVTLSAASAQALPAAQDFPSTEQTSMAMATPMAKWAAKADAAKADATSKKADPSQTGESAKTDKGDKPAKSKPKPKPTPPTKPGPRDDGDGD